MPTADEVIAALNLQPHPVEGGFFREVYRASGTLPSTVLPSGYPPHAKRSLSTCIYFLLTPATFSEMHRLPTEEVYHVYLGGPVQMLQLFEDGSGREVILGTDVLRGELPQLVVPAGVWQGSRLMPGVDFVLMGTTMSPGFDFADYEQGQREELTRGYPEFAESIARLTRL